MSARRAVWALVVLVCLGSAFAQKQKKGAESADTRSVQGTVTNAEDMPVSGAVVQLKNTKTLQIRSFITQEKGTYYFNGLSTDVDYELKADSSGLTSGSKTLSSFDSRKQATMNLQIKKK